MPVGKESGMGNALLDATVVRTAVKAVDANITSLTPIVPKLKRARESMLCFQTATTATQTYTIKIWGQLPGDAIQTADIWAPILTTASLTGPAHVQVVNYPMYAYKVQITALGSTADADAVTIYMARTE